MLLHLQDIEAKVGHCLICPQKGPHHEGLTGKMNSDQGRRNVTQSEGASETSISS